MDPFTHAASGALLALSFPQGKFGKYAVLGAALIASLPDIDIFFCHSPLAFLSLHRGISHSLILLPLFAFLIHLCWKKLPWYFVALCLLLHLWLDCITTYGTMIFQPLTDVRIRLNAIFIADPLLTILLPLLSLLAFFKKRSLALIGLVWILLYPCTNLIIKSYAQDTRAQLESSTFPDVFAPFFWRTLYKDKGQVFDASITGSGKLRTLSSGYPALPEELATSLRKQSQAANAFLNFMVLPVAVNLPHENLPPNPPKYTKALLIHDLRFGSGLDWVKNLLALRPNAQIPFRLMLLLDAQDRIVAERLVFSDAHKDSGWQSPNSL